MDVASDSNDDHAEESKSAKHVTVNNDDANELARPVECQESEEIGALSTERKVIEACEDGDREA